MITSLAEYYLEELEDWRASLHVYLQDLDFLEEWLREILQQNTIIGIAARVEHYLNWAELSRQKLSELGGKIEPAEQQLVEREMPVANESVTPELNTYQRDLRKQMFAIEKEYLETKYECSEFLAESIVQQNAKKHNKD